MKKVTKVKQQIIWECKPGDEINEKTYEYFLGVLPPIYHSNGVFQVSEPFDHVNGYATYATYQETKAKKYIYHGNLTQKQARSIK